ncbi:helix-turn-helix transcriptional regulator [Streptomyces sp. NPDC051132]|uniref:helix-turn-helix transcriptional regulator n=1 Tax=unclassified Streptomyces TaxID=2593676 RepID=UPI0034178E44
MPSEEEACRQEIARSLRQLLTDLDMITRLLRTLVDAQQPPSGPPDHSVTVREVRAHTGETAGAPLGERANSLTDRENEVFRLLLTGMTNRQIGRSLGIAERTVKNNLHSIYRKLGVAGRTEAVSKYLGSSGRPGTGSAEASHG